MKVLLVAATAGEIQGLQDTLDRSPHKTDILVTGVGMTATAHSLTRRLVRSSPDLVLNIGLAGSFHEEIRTGEVVQVVSESFGDLGAEDHVNFLTAFEIGLQKADEYPFWNGKLKMNHEFSYATLQPLKKVKGITVNTVHGHAGSIERVVRKFRPDIESMEGAAVFYSCLMEKIPFLQLRAISNRVERRNRLSWNTALALENLKQVTLQLLREINK